MKMQSQEKEKGAGEYNGKEGKDGQGREKARRGILLGNF